MVLSHKKEWNLIICNNMYGPRVYCAKWNKSDRERQMHYISLIRGIWKTKINEQTKQKQTHRYREQIDGHQMGEG